MKYRVYANQTHRLQFEVEAANEEEAVQKWLNSSGEGISFKDLDEYVTDYEVEIHGGE